MYERRDAEMKKYLWTGKLKPASQNKDGNNKILYNGNNKEIFKN